MVKPVQPSSPSASTGEGKSFLERMQRGMANDPTANPEKAKMFAEKLEKYVNEGKALNEARNEHKKVPGLSRAGGGGGGAGGDFSGMKGLDKPFKKGGKVKKYEDGGLADAMSVEKGAMAGLEDAASGPGKKGARAGLEAAKAASGLGKKGAMAGLEDIMSSAGGKGAMAGGLGMKKGGMVSSASKRADGCATKGKTRGKMV
jgi:hypothetical protein